MEAQVRRYFNGLVGLGFVGTWAAAGLLSAIGGVVLCLALVHGPGLVRQKQKRRPRAERRRPRRETRDETPLVPDEPSLVLEAGAFR
jgi:hypothetical protein